MFGKKYILSLRLINLLIVQYYRITVQPILDFFPIFSCLIQVKSFTDITLESRRIQVLQQACLSITSLTSGEKA